MSQDAQGTDAAVVLVVEDQASVLRVVERALMRSGFTVIAAESPEHGIQLLSDESRRIDLLLTDVVMPAMSGPELARVAQEHRPGLRVLFMSGYSGDSLDDQAGLENVGFVEKPFRPAELVAKVRELISRRLGA